MKTTALCLATISLGFATLSRASAEITLYNNGPINGNYNGYQISNASHVQDLFYSNSFTLSSASTVDGVDFGAWNVAGETTSSINWSIGTTVFGQESGSGAASVTSTPTGLANGNHFDVNQDSFVISPLNLGPGTYYLTLYNAIAPNNDMVLWDVNSGPSTATFGNPASHGSVPSNSFDILGSEAVSATPEPASQISMTIGALIVAIMVLRTKRATCRTR